MLPLHVEMGDRENGTFKSSILWMRAIFSSNFYGWVFASGGKMKITAP